MSEEIKQEKEASTQVDENWETTDSWEDNPHPLSEDDRCNLASLLKATYTDTIPKTQMGNFDETFASPSRTVSDVLNEADRLLNLFEIILKSLPAARTYKDFFKRQIYNIINQNIGMTIARDEVLIEWSKAGLDGVDVAAFKSMKSFQSKLENILVLQTIIQTTGLVPYMDDIIKAYIQNSMFSSAGKGSVTPSQVVDFIKSYLQK